MTRQTFWHRIKHYAVLAGIDGENYRRTCFTSRFRRIC